LETKQELEYEIKALENMKKESTDKSQQSQRTHDLMLGATLGLILGVIGNFFVTVFYPIIQTIVIKGILDNMFWGNVTMSAISFVLIVGVVIIYMRRSGKANKDDKKARDDSVLYEKILEKRKQELAELIKREKKVEDKRDREMETYGMLQGY
jgi:membrane protein implicated in regulation of membrane protease activity